MSNALAIAGVTAVLRDLLNDGFINHNVSDVLGSSVTVSALPPDRIDTSETTEKSQLNLFLFQVTPNQGWRNVGLPSRDGRGERISNPPLALDLHYLLTAYGAKDLHAEILLGYGMQLLHETPVLTRDSVRRALAPPTPVVDGGGLPTGMQALATSELAEQVEQIRISPQPMNAEEVSKLWTAFQAKYRPSAAYHASVVLIESAHSAKSALPVAGRNLYVFPFEQPTIDSLIEEAGATTPITATGSLLIKGRQLRGQSTQILIGGIDMTSHITDLSETQIKLPLLPLPAGMRSGVQPVQVVHTIAMGTPPTAHRGVESNAAAFVLRPTITPSVEPGAVSNVVDGVMVTSGQIKLDLNPKVGKSQRVVLLLNQFNAPPTGPARAYSFKAPASNGVVDPDTETASIKISFTNIVPGDYLVRVQVDGAESPLDRDPNTASPTFNQYIGPQVTIP